MDILERLEREQNLSQNIDSRLAATLQDSICSQRLLDWLSLPRPDPLLVEQLTKDLPKQVSLAQVMQAVELNDRLRYLKIGQSQIVSIAVDAYLRPVPLPPSLEPDKLSAYLREYPGCWLQIPEDGLELRWTAINDHVDDGNHIIIAIWPTISLLQQLYDGFECDDNIAHFQGELTTTLGLKSFRYDLDTRQVLEDDE